MLRGVGGNKATSEAVSEEKYPQKSIERGLGNLGKRSNESKGLFFSLSNYCPYLLKFS